MKEASQHNAEFSGCDEPLPDLPPPEFEPEDTMTRIRETKPVVTAIFTATLPGGKQIGPLIVSEPLPTECFDLGKAFSFLAARAAEQIPARKTRAGHD